MSYHQQIMQNCRRGAIELALTVKDVKRRKMPSTKVILVEGLGDARSMLKHYERYLSGVSRHTIAHAGNAASQHNVNPTSVSSTSDSTIALSVENTSSEGDGEGDGDSDSDGPRRSSNSARSQYPASKYPSPPRAVRRKSTPKRHLLVSMYQHGLIALVGIILMVLITAQVFAFSGHPELAKTCLELLKGWELVSRIIPTV